MTTTIPLRLAAVASRSEAQPGKTAGWERLTEPLDADRLSSTVRLDRMPPEDAQGAVWSGGILHHLTGLYLHGRRTNDAD